MFLYFVLLHLNLQLRLFQLSFNQGYANAHSKLYQPQAPVGNISIELSDNLSSVSNTNSNYLSDLDTLVLKNKVFSSNVLQFSRYLIICRLLLA